MNEQDNIHAKTEANQTPCIEADQATNEGLIDMKLDAKLILTFCGVLITAIVVLGLLSWSFIVQIPKAVQANHDAAIISTLERQRNREDIAKNAEAQLAASINSKGMEKAIIMLSSEVKHLSQSFDDQSERTNHKLDTLGRYWNEYTRGIASE